MHHEVPDIVQTWKPRRDHRRRLTSLKSIVKVTFLIAAQAPKTHHNPTTQPRTTLAATTKSVCIEPPVPVINCGAHTFFQRHLFLPNRPLVVRATHIPLTSAKLRPVREAACLDEYPRQPQDAEQLLRRHDCVLAFRGAALARCKNRSE